MYITVCVYIKYIRGLFKIKCEFRACAFDCPTFSFLLCLHIVRWFLCSSLFAKFWAKTTFHYYSSVVEWRRQPSKLAQNGYKWWQYKCTWLWGWKQRSFNPIEGDQELKSEKSIPSPIKCKGLAQCFLQLQLRGVS